MPVASSTGMTEGRDFGRVSFNGLSEPCAVGSIVEVVISAHSNNVEQQKGNVLVEAHSPAGRILKCPVVQRGSTYTANFTPQDVGDWQIAIFYDGEHIRGSPFLCQVYDANLVQVYGLDVGVVGQELKFNVNTSQAGKGDIKVLTYHHGRSIPCYLDRISPTFYKVKFTPDGAGQYKIHVYFNTMEVKGSPYILDIVDASSVSVYGDNLRMACVDKLATFMIHSVGSDSKDLTVTITGKPYGRIQLRRLELFKVAERKLLVRILSIRKPY
uniref:Uncharacterized protein n=1 Tax=Romanomermis culicivorax TaxID=13658 RepID=A0A915IMB9_ROMCU